jgi:hypothetical protein
VKTVNPARRVDRLDDVLKGGEYDVSRKCLQPYVQHYRLGAATGTGILAPFASFECELTPVQGGVDLPKLESEWEKQSGEQLEHPKMGLGGAYEGKSRKAIVDLRPLLLPRRDTINCCVRRFSISNITFAIAGTMQSPTLGLRRSGV